MPVVVTTEWLREFVDTDLPPGEIAERLSDVGLAVDAFEETEEGEARLELDPPTDRGDCWSVLGVARELGAALGLKLKLPTIRAKTSGAPLSKAVKVEVRAADLCPRYTARLVRGVEIRPSPEWMQKRLEAVGIRPISNVVDITNYVLVETGQPLHAFDMSLLADARIAVRRARDGEEMTLIDGTAKKLTTEDLVIADARAPVALAGVMGGADTEIRGTTREVLLESAQFDQISTRRTAKRHGVSTESSIRFEHGVDPVGVELASRRAAYLLVKHAGGKVAPGVVDSNPKAWRPRTIRLRHSRAARVLGSEIADKDVVRILKSLGLEQVPAKKTGRKTRKKAGAKEAETVSAWRTPSWRQDLTVEVDLIEEVARVYGYNRLPGSATMRVFPVRPHPVFEARRKAREVLTGLGYTEVCGASFFRPEEVELAGERGHVIRNPARADENMLRTSLLPSLLAAKRANQNIGRPVARLFEAAPVCVPGRDESKELLAILRDIESGESEKDGLLRVRGALERLAGELGGRVPVLEPFTVTSSLQQDVPEIVEGERAWHVIANGRPVGFVGMPGLVDRWDLRSSPVLAQVDLLALTLPHTAQARSLPRFPAIVRVVTLDMLESITWERITEEAAKLPHVWRSEPEFVSEFDDRSKLGAYDKAYTFRVEYRTPERTLADEEVKAPHEEFVQKLCQALDAHVRK